MHITFSGDGLPVSLFPLRSLHILLEVCRNKAVQMLSVSGIKQALFAL